MNQYKIGLFIMVSAVFFGGCKDFTEPKYEPEFPWQTIDQLEMAVAQPYTAFTGGGWSDPPSIYAFYEMLATDFSTAIAQGAPNNEWPQFVNRTHRQVDFESLPWIGGAYTNLWGTITGCNEPLEFLNGAEPKALFPNDPDSKLAEIPRIKAELYFWRGFAYTWAALYFCPPYVPGGANNDRVIPLKTTNLDANNTPIGTTQEIWDLIISDLTTAKSLMPKTWHVNGRIDYYTICGALARAYFYTGDYSKAEAECTEIISSGKYSLPADVMAAWTVPMGGAEPSEVIWMYDTNTHGLFINIFTVLSRAYPYDDNIHGGRGKGSQCTWVTCKLSDAMAKKLGWMVDPANGDYTVTATALADKRYGNTWLRVEGYKPADQVEAEVTATGDQTVWDKYEQNYDSQDMPHIYLDKYYRGYTPSKTNQPRMRIPEFYIMRAAIRYKNNDKNGAAADLKVVRDRAGLPEISGADITDADIDREMIIEMGGEGLYLPYLMALQKPILPGDRTGVSPVNPPYTGWYWKIPINEVRINAGYIGIPDPNSK